jgi:lysophospholipase L1-like esterase
MIKNFIVLISTLFLSVVLGEVGLRFIVEEVNFLNPQMMTHPVLRHAIVPGSSGHDEWGFRNFDVPAEVRIVAIGDSQTYGTSVPAIASWPAWIERHTQTKVYNMGVGGYGPPDYHYLLNHKARLLKPCLVFIGFYLGNDLPRSYHFANNIETTSVALDPQGRGDMLMSLRAWMSRNSLIYQMAKAFGGGLIDYLQFHDSRWKSDGDSYPVTAQNWRTVLKPGPRFAALDQSRDVNREGLFESLRILDRIQDDCRKMNTQCVVVLIPTKITVYWPVAREILSGEGFERVHAVVEEEAAVRRAVSKQLNMRGIEFVDPVEVLQAAARREPLYPSNDDGHLNTRGNELLAAAILRDEKPEFSCHSIRDAVN